LNDLKKIKQRARDLAKPEPSKELWMRIQSRLKEKTQAPVKVPSVRFLLFPARLRYAVSAALLVFIVAGALILGLRTWGRRVPGREISGQELALMKIQEAEQYYKLAIKALWEAVQAQKENIDPDVAETFRVNLELIDASLAECRRFVEKNPDDVESRYYLLAVYKKKAELLDSMMEVSSATPQSRESKSIL